MSEPITWRMLHRCDDLLEARAVATAIAAMEFEVRVVGSHVPQEQTNDCCGECSTDFPGPFIIEVPAEDWPQLKQALPEIIAEQKEFDRLTADDAQIHTAAFKAAIAVMLIIALIYLVAQLSN